MSEAFTAVWPLPPSLNLMYRHVAIKGQARVLLSKRARDYYKLIGDLYGVDASKKRQDRRGETFFSDDANLTLDLFVRVKGRRRADLDNYLKITQDALQKCQIIADDKQITRLRVELATEQPSTYPLGEMVLTLTEE